MKYLFLLGLMAAGSAFAGTITFNTTSSQLCVGASGCGVSTQTIGGGSGIIVTFNPIASSTVDASPTTFGSFGELDIDCVGGGTACGSQSLAGLNLFINITQTVPTAGSASISGGVIAGSISGTASSATITWSVPNAVSVGNVSYSVLNTPLGLVPPSVNSGVTSIQAQITDNTRPTEEVPEPSTYALISAGLLGIGLLRNRLSR